MTSATNFISERYKNNKYRVFFHINPLKLYLKNKSPCLLDMGLD